MYNEHYAGMDLEYSFFGTRTFLASPKPNITGGSYNTFYGHHTDPTSLSVET